jgi:glycosyltransferase involved in cell wall biosynthesis
MKRGGGKAWPEISIVVPSRNAGATIGRALGSLVKQEYPSLQIICVDGNSTDDTLDRIGEYRSAVSQVISEPDRNSADALNKGFRLATGDYLGWLCADDELAPGALFKFMEVFEAHPEADLVTGGCRRFYADGSEQITCPPAWLQKVISMKNYIEQPSTLWRRDLHRRAGELDISFNMAFDHELWCRFDRLGANFFPVPDVLSHYHFSACNLTSQGGRKLVGEMYRVTRKYGPYRGRTADIYRFLYHNFDLKGYFDYENAGKIAPLKMAVFKTLLAAIRTCFGRMILDNYNWNFASKQERGICWYK